MALRFPRPEDVSASLWIDEAIWGNRLYNEQTPWMTLLEMLGVLNDLHATGEPFTEPLVGGEVAYRPRRRMRLRNILFNSPSIVEIARKPLDDEQRWAQWRERMQKDARGLSDGADFSYVRELFTHPTRSFEDFAELVTLLRSTSLEVDSNKRWTSKFVFPYGPDGLFVDVRIKSEGGGRHLDMDRRFFARNGELLYLMLCRSGRGPALFEHLRPLVLDPKAPWNRILARLDGPLLPEDNQAIRLGYLPLAESPAYGALADDLLAVLQAKLPGYDALPHLVDVIGLHLTLYLLREAEQWTEKDGPLRLVLEIIAPKKTVVRELSSKSFRDNCERTGRAVEAYARDTVERTEHWARARESADTEARRDLLRGALAPVLGDPDEPPEAVESALSAGAVEPHTVLTALVTYAKERHEQHFGACHAAWTQAIGLATRRGTNRVRYAPSDHLLKTLVLAVVKDRMEFQEFLEALWARYRFVIGHRQAASLVGDGEGDRVAFEDNARRLEQRLASLGLLRRLSDACAYVENPMGGAR